jgi:hypothetical protein
MDIGKRVHEPRAPLRSHVAKHRQHPRTVPIGTCPPTHTSAANKSRFSFEPSKVFLAVTPGNLGGSGRPGSPSDFASSDSDAGDRVTIQVRFNGSEIGDFTEMILFRLEGSAEPLRLVYKGRALGPCQREDGDDQSAIAAPNADAPSADDCHKRERGER